MFFHIPVKEAKLIRHDENGWTEIVQEDATEQKTATGAKNRKTKAVPERTEDQPTDDSVGSSGDR